MDSRSKLIRHEDIPKIVGVPPVRANFCQVFGQCVCHCDAWHFHKNLASLLKSHFTPPRKKKGQVEGDELEPPMLAQLDSLFVVLRLQRGQRNAPKMAGSWASVLQADMDECQDVLLGAQADEEAAEFWFHIGDVNYKSWMFSLMRLHFVAETRADTRFKLVVALESEADASVLLMRQLVDLRYSWECSIFTIVDGDDELDPDTCQH